LKVSTPIAFATTNKAPQAQTRILWCPPAK
jgi:hypothetical protein